MSDRILAEMKNKKKVVILLIFVLLAGTAAILGYFFQQERSLQAERNSLTATGTVEAKTVMLSFKVPGRIEEVLVDEGSEVEEGQKVARLESRELEAKLLQAQGVYQAAEAAIEQARALVAKAEVGLTNAGQQYERVNMMYDKGAVSQSQFDAASNAYEAARKELNAAQGKLDEALAAQSKQAKGALEEATAYVDNTQLQSPTSGFVTGKMLEEGEMLGAGTPVLEITDIRHSYVKVFIDETKIGRVHLNQNAEVKVDSFPDRVFEGRVVWINSAGQFAVHKAINEQYSHDIRSFEVKIDLPNEELLLKTGMTARVEILEGEQ